MRRIDVAQAIITNGIRIAAQFACDPNGRRHEQSLGSEDIFGVRVALAYYLLKKVDMGAGVGLAREEDDRCIMSAQLFPVGELPSKDSRRAGQWSTR